MARSFKKLFSPPRSICFVALLASLLLLSACAETTPPDAEVSPSTFDGALAYEHVVAQCDLGFRPPGSEAGRATGDYIIDQLEARGWEVETQEFTYRETGLRNIIGRMGEGPVLIVGAHYDTRRSADQEDPSTQVMGANDGASGVAVLLELARSLDPDQLDNEVWLAFFDAEDNGGLDGWEWCVGSSYMAENLEVTPEAVVVVDMVGDADQTFYFEGNSDLPLQQHVWSIAATLGYTGTFITEGRWLIYDDHIPFIEQGITAIDIIDFAYPYWHTTQDTPDKVSPQSLERIGRVMEAFLEENSSW
jgi:Zn-dependent M28 family amino/carboxypeptidase